MINVFVDFFILRKDYEFEKLGVVMVRLCKILIEIIVEFVIFVN